MPDPNRTPERRGAVRPDGAACGACCFLRRHDPFQVRRVERPSVPQSQSSAEDTPTGGARKRRSLPQRKRNPCPLPVRGRISTLTVTRSREHQRVDRENATELYSLALAATRRLVADEILTGDWQMRPG